MNRETRRSAGHAARGNPSATHPPAQAAFESQLRQAVLDALLHGGAPEGEAFTVAPAAAPLAPAVLAQAHAGGSARREAEAMYGRCLAHYRQVVRPGVLRATASTAPLDTGLDDVGAAAAFFVAVNMVALHGGVASAQTLLALERQLGAVVRITSSWAEAEARARQLYFEKLAVLAVYMQELQAAAPQQGAAAVARVRQAARTYLRELLALEGDALTLGERGLQPQGGAER